MKIEVATSLLLFCAVNCVGQDLTVRVLGERSSQPVADALVKLHLGCTVPVHATDLKQKTDAAGVVVFRSVHLAPEGVCVLMDEAYEARELPYLFTTPEQAASVRQVNAHVRSALPDEVVFHVRRLTVWERFRKRFTFPA